MSCWSWLERRSGANTESTPWALCILHSARKKNGVSWSPLTDDGDAMRLALALDFTIEVERFAVSVSALPTHEQSDADERGDLLATEPWHENGPNKTASTRRAIVRAAAEMAKAAG